MKNIRIPVEVADVLQNYDYLLRDPRDGVVFYVGKGKGDRVHSHVAEAERGGGKNKVQRIRSIQDAGLAVEHLIVRS